MQTNINSNETMLRGENERLTQALKDAEHELEMSEGRNDKLAIEARDLKDRINKLESELSIADARIEGFTDFEVNMKEAMRICLNEAYVLAYEGKPDMMHRIEDIMRDLSIPLLPTKASTWTM